SGTFLLSAYTAATKNRGRNAPSVYGCDIQARMVLTAILNCLVHGIRDPHVVHQDGLKLDLNEWHRRDSSVPKAGFTLIVGNPPFAGFDVDKSTHVPKDTRPLEGGPKIHKIIPFIDRVLQFLAPGGRAALVVPTSVLNGEAPSFRNLRQRL